MVAAKAKKFLLIIAPAGTGKSAAFKYLEMLVPKTMFIDSVTRTGLQDIAEDFQSFDGEVIVDDIAKIGTPYRRISTCTVMAELVYGHKINEHAKGLNLVIEGFDGGAVMGVQPTMLADLVKAPEWETTLADKTLRYYHLFRPNKPTPQMPKLEFNWGGDAKSVKIANYSVEQLAELTDIVQCQWRDSRIVEHVPDILCALAALDQRTKTNDEDFLLFKVLFGNMCLEEILFTKSSLESERNMLHDLYLMCVEFASYDNLRLQTIAHDYKCSLATVNRVLNSLPQYIKVLGTNPRKITLSEELKMYLTRSGAIQLPEAVAVSEVQTNGVKNAVESLAG